MLDSVMLKVEDVEMEALLPWKRLERGLWPVIVAAGCVVRAELNVDVEAEGPLRPLLLGFEEGRNSWKFDIERGVHVMLNTSCASPMLLLPLAGAASFRLLRK